MGSGPISTAVDGTIIPADDHNELKSALLVDQVPRDASGVATADAGDVGTTTFPFKSANITSGYFFTGMIVPYHDFNGTVSPGQGWMQCDGTIINEANYDAIHGAGSWDTYVGASALDGKNTPNMTTRYPVGVAATTQDGSVAITEVGNADSEIDEAAHTHTTASHNHQWYKNNPTGGVADQTFDASGDITDIVATGGGSGGDRIPVFDNGASVQDSFTNTQAGSITTSAGGFTNKNIQPASIEVEYWIRVI